MRLPAPRWKLAAFAAIALALPALAAAHPGADAGRHDGFLQGFVHPFSGLDHLLAMGAVGAWAGLRGGNARWLAPLVFVTLLVAGALAAAAGLAPAGVEPMVAASLVAFGLLLAGPGAAATPAALVVIGVLAVVHGAAHGLELAGAALAGMAAGSTLLHVAGLGLGSALRTRPAAWAAALGTGTIAAGTAMLSRWNA